MRNNNREARGLPCATCKTRRSSSLTSVDMSDTRERAPAPVSPSVIKVHDLLAVCDALGLPAPAQGATTMEMELEPSCVINVAETDGEPTPFVYLCVRDLSEARHFMDDTYATAESGPDSVDPESYRLRGCILRGGGIVIDAVQCPVAGENGVPCSPDCSPFLSFI